MIKLKKPLTIPKNVDIPMASLDWKKWQQNNVEQQEEEEGVSVVFGGVFDSFFCPLLLKANF